jgi:TolB protein
VTAVRALAVAVALLATVAAAPAAERPPRSESDPLWSPDGRSLLFRRDGADGKPALWVSRVDGSGARRLRGNVSSAAWSPDGRRIVWDTFRRTESNELRGDVHLMAVDGSRPRQLTRGPAFDVAPFWRHDGKRIFWTIWRDRRPRLWSMRPDGGGKKLVFGATRSVGLGAVARDGRWFAFTDGFNGGDLFIGRLDGTQVVRIARGDLIQPVWAPTGDRIAFLVVTAARLRLDLVDADGRGRRTLVRDVGLDGGVSWSPNGRTLAVTMGDLPQRIWLVDVATGRRTRLLRPRAGEYEEAGAQWSPDGRWIAFTRTDEGAGSRIFLVRPDGTRLHPLLATR